LTVSGLPQTTIDPSVPRPLFGTASEIDYLCRICTTYENGLLTVNQYKFNMFFVFESLGIKLFQLFLTKHFFKHLLEYIKSVMVGIYNKYIYIYIVHIYVQDVET